MLKVVNRTVSQFFPAFQRQVAIIGAGQAGTPLAIELLRKGVDVTLYNNRTPQQIEEGRILSSQAMFDSALWHERRLGLNFYENVCPKNHYVSFNLAVPGAPVIGIGWKGKTQHFYRALDQRLIFPRMMQEFQKMGGKLIIKDISLSDLDDIALRHHLTLVAGGKGEISQKFERNPIRSHFDKPQRTLACMYLKGVIPEEKAGVCGNIIPGIGEVFIVPGLTLSGACEMLLIEAIPRGPFDCWNGITDPYQQWDTAKGLLKKHVPWIWKRCENATLTDAKATLTGAITPTVRYPTFELPCGKSVMAIGDTATLNDPIAGQGANTAMKAAAFYARQITHHDSKAFTPEWMHQVSEEFWHKHGKWATKWSHLLSVEPAPHMVELLSAAATHQSIADTFAEGFNNPQTLFPWIMCPEDSKRIIATFNHRLEQSKAAAPSPQPTPPRMALRI